MKVLATTTTTTTTTTYGWETSQVPPLTKAQEMILLRGPNFATVPKSPPVGKYIASIENAGSQLRQGEVQE